MRRRCGRGSERRRIVEVGDGSLGVVGAVAVCPLDLCAVVGPQQILELGSRSRSGCGLRRRSGAAGVVPASGSWRLATRNGYWRSGRRLAHLIWPLMSCSCERQWGWMRTSLTWLMETWRLLSRQASMRLPWLRMRARRRLPMALRVMSSRAAASKVCVARLFPTVLRAELSASAETAPLLAEIPPPSRRNGAVVSAVRN